MPNSNDVKAIYPERSTVRVKLLRGFAQASILLLNSLSQFLDKHPVALEGTSPSGRAQDMHIEGLNLLRDAIQESLDEELPPLRCTIGLSDNEGQTIFIQVGAQSAQSLVEMLGRLAEFSSRFVEIDNFAQCEDEMLQARVAVEKGDDYEGELVVVTQRRKA